MYPAMTKTEFDNAKGEIKMSKFTSAGLVAFAKAKLGTAYVYGMKGARLTEAKYLALKKQYGNLVWDSDRSKIGKVCVDCSGLISWYTGKVINSTAFKNTATKILPISQIAKAVPGCAVWRKGHIGVYIGNGEIIEARGSAYGVVKTKVSARDFTHILWLRDIDYTAADEPQKQDSAPAKVTYYPACKYSGVSIVDGLKSIGAESSYAHRKKIAAANGISGYRGTARQNTEMLGLLKAGKLVKAK